MTKPSQALRSYPEAVRRILAASQHSPRGPLAACGVVPVPKLTYSDMGLQIPQGGFGATQSYEVGVEGRKGWNCCSDLPREPVGRPLGGLSSRRTL